MSRYAAMALAALRIVAGLLFACHGAQKLLGWFGGMPPGTPMTPMVMTAGIIELVGGVLIMIGLFTRLAAFISSGEMAFAYFMKHAPGGFWPLQNHGELAVIYCFLFLYLTFAGSGSWSVDDAIRRRGQSKLT